MGFVFVCVLAGLVFSWFADRIRVEVETTDACQFKLRPDAKVSGLGHIHDNYYHFMIDFAPRVA